MSTKQFWLSVCVALCTLSMFAPLQAGAKNPCEDLSDALFIRHTQLINSYIPEQRSGSTFPDVFSSVDFVVPFATERSQRAFLSASELSFVGGKVDDILQVWNIDEPERIVEVDFRSADRAVIETRPVIEITSILSPGQNSLTFRLIDVSPPVHSSTQWHVMVVEPCQPTPTPQPAATHTSEPTPTLAFTPEPTPTHTSTLVPTPSPTPTLQHAAHIDTNEEGSSEVISTQVAAADPSPVSILLQAAMDNVERLFVALVAVLGLAAVWMIVSSMLMSGEIEVVNDDTGSRERTALRKFGLRVEFRPDGRLRKYLPQLDGVYGYLESRGWGSQVRVYWVDTNTTNELELDHMDEFTVGPYTITYRNFELVNVHEGDLYYDYN